MECRSNDGEECVLVNAEQFGEGFGISRKEGDNGEAELSSVLHAGVGVLDEVREKDRKERLLQFIEYVTPLFLGRCITGRLTLQITLHLYGYKSGE